MNNRKSIAPNEDRSLVAEVGGFCPLCNKSLFLQKNGKRFKNYEIAHIYPCNPTPREKVLLKGCELLSDNSEDEINKLALCVSCHTAIDCERTVEEYEKLVELKKAILEKKSIRSIINEISLQDDIIEIINNLIMDLPNATTQIKIKAVKVERKISDPLLCNKIRKNVADYYKFIDNHFKRLNLKDRLYELILLNFREAFLRISTNEMDEQVIFDNMVNWLSQQSKNLSRTANEIVISYFIQHCEVFNDISE